MECKHDFKFCVKFEKDGEEYIEERCAQCDEPRILPVKIGLKVPASVQSYEALFKRRGKK